MLKLIDRATDAIGAVCAWLTPIMVLLTVIIVVLRYALETGTIALQEAVVYVHALVFMLGLSYTLKHDGHVRVDLLYSRLTHTNKLRVNLAGHLIFLLPICAFIIYSSSNYVLAAWRVMEGSSEVGGLPFVYLLKTLIPVSAVLLALQGLTEIARTIGELRQPR